VLSYKTQSNSNEEVVEVIEKGSKVSIEYTLYLEDGTVEDTNVGGEPLVYEQGAGNILPALEYILQKLGPGDTRKVTLSPKEAYGRRHPQKMQYVPKDRFPEDALEPGTMVQARGSDGNPVSFMVAEVQDDSVLIDLNHPLADKTLTFDVKILFEALIWLASRTGGEVESIVATRQIARPYRVDFDGASKAGLTGQSVSCGHRLHPQIPSPSHCSAHDLDQLPFQMIHEQFCESQSYHSGIQCVSLDEPVKACSSLECEQVTIGHSWFDPVQRTTESACSGSLRRGKNCHRVQL